MSKYLKSITLPMADGSTQEFLVPYGPTVQSDISKRALSSTVDSSINALKTELTAVKAQVPYLEQQSTLLSRVFRRAVRAGSADDWSTARTLAYVTDEMDIHGDDLVLLENGDGEITYAFEEGKMLWCGENTRRGEHIAICGTLSDDDGLLQELNVERVSSPGSDVTVYICQTSGAADELSHLFEGKEVSGDISLAGFADATSMANCFRHCHSLESVTLECLDARKVTDMDYMFQGDSRLREVILPQATPALRQFRAAFHTCRSLMRVDGLQNIDTSRCTSLEGMFTNCESLTQIDVENLRTDSCTSLSSMFSNCTMLRKVNVSLWKTGNVTTIYDLFSGCSSLLWADVSEWDTSEVTTMTGAFYGCSSLTQIPVAKWNVGKVKDMRGMFQGCSSLTHLYLDEWETPEVTTFHNFLADCTSLKELYAPKLSFAACDSDCWSLFATSHTDGIASALTSLVMGGVGTSNKQYNSNNGTPHYSFSPFQFLRMWGAGADGKPDTTAVRTIYKTLHDLSVDRSSETIPFRVILHKDALARLSDTQKAAITARGYTLMS